VQIQHAIDGQLNWFVHSNLEYVRTMCCAIGYA